VPFQRGGWPWRPRIDCSELLPPDQAAPSPPLRPERVLAKLGLGSLDGLPLDDVARSTSLLGTHWASLLRLLPLYRAVSRVRLGDGKRTSF
jgi:hypothetical protein